MTDAIKKDIARLLLSFNESFFGKLDNPFLGGRSFLSSTTGTGFINSDTTDTIGAFHKRLFDGQYSTALTPRYFQATTTNPLLYVLYGNNSTYSNVSASTDNIGSNLLANIGDNQPSFGLRVTDINVFHMIANANEQNIMNGLYALYDLMDEGKWEEFKSKAASNQLNTMTLKIAAITSNNLNQSVGYQSSNLGAVLGADAHTILSSLAANDSFKPFALRRIVYLYIRMFSFYIALDYYNSGNDSQKEDRARIAQAVFNLLDNHIQNLSQDIMTKVQGGVNKRISRYNSYTDKLNELNDEYDLTRTFTKTQVERLSAEEKYEKRANVMMYVALAVLIVAFFVSVGSVFLDMEFKNKLLVCGGTAAFAAVTGLVIIVMFTKQVVEGFNTYTSAFQLSSTGLSNTVSANNVISVYNTAILEAARDYLSSVLTLVQSLTNYKTFGSVTFTQAKEYRYFIDTNDSTRNTGEKYKSAHRASDLYQKKYGASVYLFVVLAILISITAMAYIGAAEKMPAAAPFVLGISGFVAFVTLVIYILEITGYVRTDGDKKYWGKPNTNNL